ncbi:MAG: glycosyltransferase family 4 protein [Acidimicrobiia bacterium]
MDRPAGTVLFVAVPAAIGGSNRALLTLLGAMGGKVGRAVAAPRDGAFARAATGMAEEWVATPRPRWGRLGRVVGAIRIAGWALRRRRLLTAIHANTTTGLYLAAPAAMLTRVRLVVWIHDPVSTAWGRRIGPVLRRLLGDVAWVAVSPTAARVAATNGLCAIEEVELIPNPIDPDQVVGIRSAPNPRPVIAYLSGGTNRKGFDLLPRVMERLADLPVEWRLFLTRNESPFNAPVWAQLDSLRSQPAISLSILGRQPDVRVVYGQADIVFIPSREESFSLLTAESMLNGIPVVASDLEPIRSLLGEGEGGLVFPTEDVGGAAGALRRLATDPQLRERMGERGRVRASVFSPLAVAERMLAVYRASGNPGGEAERRPGGQKRTGRGGSSAGANAQRFR